MKFTLVHLSPEAERCTLSQPDHVYSPPPPTERKQKPKEKNLRNVKKKEIHPTAIFEHAANDLATCGPAEHGRIKPRQVAPQPREKHIVDSLIENMWKAHYQKGLLQSLKQNASIKYIIYCFQV